MNAIEIKNLTCGYNEKPVLSGVSIAVQRGSFTGVLGPNGSGKTTLIRAISGVLPIQEGSIAINGRDIKTFSRREIAREIACVMQEHQSPDELAFTVREIVTMGRTPYLSTTGWETDADREAVTNAMTLGEVAHLAGRSITELSGGERQRAFIAAALAQDCPLILLDEPTNHLDISHQASMLNLFSSLTQKGRTVAGVFHDLNLASEYCDELVILKNGAVAASGRPADVLGEKLIRDIYGAGVTITANPASGRPQVFINRQSVDSDILRG